MKIRYGIKFLTKMALVAFLTGFASPSFAAITCSGHITNLALNPAGTVQVNYGYGWHYLCNLTSLYGTATPEGCRGLYSMLLTAQSTKRAVSFSYNGYAACADIGSWLAPNPLPYFVMISE